jgi:hypothetical protein
MASILQINGKWRALVRKRNAKARCKTFATEEDASAWAAQQESEIEDLSSGVHVNPAKGASTYHVSGVYMLLQGSTVRYIGRSSHIYRRLNDHSRKGVEWNKFKIFPCRDAVRMAELERELIAKYQPDLNIAMKDRPVVRSGGKNPDIFTRYQKQ